MKVCMKSLCVILVCVLSNHALGDNSTGENYDLSRIAENTPNQYQFGVATTNSIVIDAPPNKVWETLLDMPTWSENVVYTQTQFGSKGERGEIFATVTADGQPGNWAKVVKSVSNQRWVIVYFAVKGENKGAEFHDFTLEAVNGGTKLTRRVRYIINRLAGVTMDEIVAKENAYYAFDGGAGVTNRELENIKRTIELGVFSAPNKVTLPQIPATSPNQFRFTIAFEDKVLINKPPEVVWQTFSQPGWGELAAFSVNRHGTPGERGEVRAYVERNGHPGDWSRIFKIVPNRQKIHTWFDPSTEGTHSSRDGAAITDFELVAVDGGTQFVRRMYMSIPYDYNYLAQEGEEITLEAVTGKEDWYYGFEDGPARFRRDLERLKSLVESN